MTYSVGMKFGIRIPSFKKRVAARTSWKRVVRHNLGLKAPRGWGWVTNPKKAAYNRVYNRTTVGLESSTRGSEGPSSAASSNEGCGCLFIVIVCLVAGGSFDKSGGSSIFILAGLLAVVGIVRAWRSA
jgi:hypothetical protein